MTNKRGGPNRGQGRKPLSASEPTVTVCLRMPESLRDKLLRLGKPKATGKTEWGEWLRGVIYRAKEPKE